MQYSIALITIFNVIKVLSLFYSSIFVTFYGFKINVDSATIVFKLCKQACSWPVIGQVKQTGFI